MPSAAINGFNFCDKKVVIREGKDYTTRWIIRDLNPGHHVTPPFYFGIRNAEFGICPFPNPNSIFYLKKENLKCLFLGAKYHKCLKYQLFFGEISKKVQKSLIPPIKNRLHRRA
jgi:hypothetical protein